MDKAFIMPLVSLQNVGLSLRANSSLVDILYNINLQVFAGERVGILGHSGAGKSSLMLLIAGLELASKGEVRFAGQDWRALDEEERAAQRLRGIGIVFQSFHLIPSFTALENVALPLELLGHNNAYKEAEDWLGKVGLGKRGGHYPAQLSGGEQQRVAIARALAARPRLLLADEPTGNLDEATGRGVIELLFDLQKESGTTMLIITHDQDLAGRCERVIRMSEGKIDG